MVFVRSAAAQTYYCRQRSRQLKQQKTISLRSFLRSPPLPAACVSFELCRHCTENINSVRMLSARPAWGSPIALTIADAAADGQADALFTRAAAGPSFYKSSGPKECGHPSSVDFVSANSRGKEASPTEGFLDARRISRPRKRKRWWLVAAVVATALANWQQCPLAPSKASPSPSLASPVRPKIARMFSRLQMERRQIGQCLCESQASVGQQAILGKARVYWSAQYCYNNVS